MWINSTSNGGWRCRVKGRERQRATEQKLGHNARRIRVRAGGIQFYLGLAPTVEEAKQLRQKIREEAPGGPACQ